MGVEQPGTARAVWIDVVRGLCVIAVVMLHVRIFVYDPSVPEIDGADEWRRITEAFGPFRLPTLFTISGLLVAGRVRQGWSDRRNAVRVVSSYWLYLVWLTVFALMSLAVTAPGMPFRLETPTDYLRQIVLPDTILWFVLALAVYVLVLTSLQRVPPTVVLGGLALLAALSGVAPAELAEEQWLHILYYGVFFAAGVYLPGAVRWFAGGRVVVKLGCALALFLVLERVWQLTEMGTALESSVRLVRDLVAVAVAVGLCALIARAAWLARPLALVGRRTLPIYILQLPAIWLLCLVPVVADLHDAPVVFALGPVLGTAFVVAASMLGFTLVRGTVLENLFRLPRPLADRILTPPSVSRTDAR
ncbi:acyltransferase [Herbiconiux sp. KACC 21604]|uniref:acyltransferase family protein n=1 Tax=unclassified Herbiconiux TaxID=2618217 RepID=UPI001490F6A7|nr:acyltransferase [Herbiconiux sp. SALV-R1]QJU52644.1 acyltransferase [Herbiconiux sp. SALV-R1]WPO87536.1 acyltransferase [Herbiconiux sp. KACC 21604]